MGQAAPSIALERVADVVISPTTPFHFDSTFFKPAHFPSGDNAWESGRRWQTMLWQGERLGLILADTGTPTAPQVTVGVYADGELSLEFLGSICKPV